MTKSQATTATTSTTATVVKPKQKLKGMDGYVLPNDPYNPARLALDIMSYRRQYGSQGIANFDETYFQPLLKKIVADLEHRGYTVAVKVLGASAGDRNYMFDVSKDSQVSDTLYVAHYDTVDRDKVGAYTNKTWDAKKKQWVEKNTPTTEERLRKVIDVEKGIAFLKEGDPTNECAGCLGADDGAGLAVMLHLMHKGVLGGYCFTTGEECGGIGAIEVFTNANAFLKQYKRSIEIDRRGNEDIIYEQGVGECASIAFTDWVCEQLKMGHKACNLGSYTDVATFAELIPENINIAAGYINAHSADEQVSLPYLETLADNLAKIDWSKAPTKRTAGDFGLPSYSSSYGYGYGYGYDLKTSRTKKYQRNTKTTDRMLLSETDLKTLNVLFTSNLDFMEYALSVGVSTYAEYEEVIESYFGITVAELEYTLQNFTGDLSNA